MSAPAGAAVGAVALMGIGLLLDAQVVGTSWNLGVTAVKAALLGLFATATVWVLRLSPRAVVGWIRGQPS